MEEEFKKMIFENKSLILRICRFYNAWHEKEAIEDLYQEIVLNLWKSYPKFINNQQCKASTWIYRIALNTALLQKRSRSKITYVTLNNHPVANQISNDSNNSQIGILYRLIEKLNEEEKAIIYLYLDDLSHKEIAEIIGISETNVGTKIHRIKIKLKKMNETHK
jgi:RNA polymerase sigma-70 factor (ECF subfamily)